MPSKLYVGGLAYSTSDADLEALFATHGKVLSAIIIKDRDSGQSKGFGFVEMEEDADAQTAIKELNDTEVGGRRIMVNVARPQEDRPRGGGGGNGGGGGFHRSY